MASLSPTDETSETGTLLLRSHRDGARAYTIRVEAPGFRPIEQKGNMVLNVRKSALGKRTLEVGQRDGIGSGNGANRHRWPHYLVQSATIDSKRWIDRVRAAIQCPYSDTGRCSNHHPTRLHGEQSNRLIPRVSGRTQAIYTDGVNGGEATAEII